MPLVTGDVILQAARKGGYAVGAFNANNLESVKAVLETCDEMEAPVILQVSQGAIKYAGLHYATAMVKAGAEKVKIPVALHLDHGTSFEQNCQCLAAGFTSLMYDGSKEPYEENVATTALIARVAHAAGVPVEAELGIVPKIEDFTVSDETMETLRKGECDNIYDYLSPEDQKKVDDWCTKPELAKDFHDKTQCDSLAVAIGAIHGMEGQAARLNFDLLQALMDAVDIPFVLHAASGIRLDDVRKACSMGICKVNVATRISMELLRGTKERLEAKPKEKDFRKVFDLGMEYIAEVIKEYLDLFGAAGKAYTAGWVPGTVPEITKESPE
ncbi:MAG: class II fructose-bisphosphate aldolase [Candidatus Zipacnadales bacterium]